MTTIKRLLYITCVLSAFVHLCGGAKINTPRVLLPWFEDLNVNFTFEIIEGGCYTWSLSRDDIIDLEPVYDESWGHCSRAARVSVSKSCIPPGTVIILAQEINTGEILRGDVDINTITSLKVTSTTWKLYLEEAPEAFDVIAYDDQGNKFSTLEGITFTWSIENVHPNLDESLVTMVNWHDTDYESPRGISEIESQGLKSYTVLLYGQAMGEARVTVCLDNICNQFTLHVVASVVLMPSTAIIAPEDTLNYRVVRARAGRLTVQDVAETMYYLQLPENKVAQLEDAISLVKGTAVGSTAVLLMSGSTDVSTAVLTVAEPHSIRVSLRPPHLVVRDEKFIIHCAVLDTEGRLMTAGDQMLIQLSLVGEANVELLNSNNNGTISDAIARSAGPFTVTAELHSIAGRPLAYTVEGQTSGVAVEPLQVVPPELYISWTDSIQDVTLEHRGGGEESVIWSEIETNNDQGTLSLAPSGTLTIKGVGEINVKVKLQKYPHVEATGRVIVAPPEFLQVSCLGNARVDKPHQIHVTLTAVHPFTGEFYNFHKCNCKSFVTSLIEGQDLNNVIAAPWITPIEGACCVLEGAFGGRGAAAVRVAARGAGAGAGDVCRVLVRAAPQLLWPPRAAALAALAALAAAELPVLALGDALMPQSKDERIADLLHRDGPPPDKYPDLQLFTLRCHKRGDTHLQLVSQTADYDEMVDFEVACANHVSRVRIEALDAQQNCSGGSKLWFKPGQEVKFKVTLLDAIGRELLDERGPKVSWETSPANKAIQYRTTDRLFVKIHPEFAPVPVPYYYYQVVSADEKAVGWKGTLTASVPDAVASIQAQVVAPLTCDTQLVNLAWEGEQVGDIAEVSGGSGRYSVAAPVGVKATIEEGKLTALVPGPGSYDFVISDLCIASEKISLEVHVEEVVSVEAVVARAVAVGGCVPLAATARGATGRPLRLRASPQWRAAAAVRVRDGELCGEAEGGAAVRAGVGHVWSRDAEVLVFASLEIIPNPVKIPIGAKLQLRYSGGPPSHLATLHYEAVDGIRHIEVTPLGLTVGTSFGKARVRLTARDVANTEIASTEAEVEVVPITGLRPRSATQTLLVGAPCPLWLEADGLGPSVLWGLQPSPRVTWTLKDPTMARFSVSHIDDKLERPVAEGLAIRVVPLKPGIITIDVRVRNMGKTVETRSLDSVIEIEAIRDIEVGVEGAPEAFAGARRVALAVGAALRLRSAPRAQWLAHAPAHAPAHGAAFELSPGGDLRALKPGGGVAVAQHNVDNKKIYRETIVHVEVWPVHYCTAEEALAEESAQSAVRVVARSAVGRELFAPHLQPAVSPPLAAYARKSPHSALGYELVLAGLDSAGAFLTFHGTVGDIELKDEIWVSGSDVQSDKIIACGGWAVCLPGTGWRAPAGVRLASGARASVAVLAQAVAAALAFRAERPPRALALHQLPVAKMEFLPGEWPYSLVPLTIQGTDTTSGPILCTEEERASLVGLDVELPFTCYTQAPHTAAAILDFKIGQMGCSIVPASPITEASEVEICAEWGLLRTCTRTLLLPQIQVAPTILSLQNKPSTFNIFGHRHALKLLMITTSPGLSVELNTKTDGEIEVSVKSEGSSCGHGWVNVRSRLTNQEEVVEVRKECDVTCGSLLDAIFSLLKQLPNWFVAFIAAGVTIYMYGKMYQKSDIRQPMAPPRTLPPPTEATPPFNRSRTYSRSPYASNGPAGPIYGDTSVLPDNSYSPNSTRNNSRFL